MNRTGRSQNLKIIAPVVLLFVVSCITLAQQPGSAPARDDGDSGSPKHFDHGKFSPDLKFVAAVHSLDDLDKSPDLKDSPPILVRELANGRETHLRSKGGAKWIGSLIFSPSSAVIVASHLNNTVTLWDVRKNGEEIGQLDGHGGGQVDLAMSYSGLLATYGLNDGKIFLYDLRHGVEPVKTMAAHIIYPTMVFTPDSKLLAIGGGKANCGDQDGCEFVDPKERPADIDADYAIKIFDVSGGRKLKVLTGHRESVEALVFTADGRLLASGDLDGSIRLWDAATWRELRKFGNREQVVVLRFSPDGSFLAAGTSDGQIELWDVATGRQIRTLTGQTYEILDLAFTPDGKQLLSLDSSKQLLVRCWDVASGKEIALRPTAGR
jgi:WD40 repeat protein